MKRLLAREPTWGDVGIRATKDHQHFITIGNVLPDGIGASYMSVQYTELRMGVAVRAVLPMYSVANGRPGLVLGIGAFNNDQIEQATQLLATVITAAADKNYSQRP
ncbi:hypothetical protein QU487_11650 [Crenobacter sp. SG2305]|uniref:hypothetical protein n=1 Tax=Crenobacter oryzisoli TaxID=3056844 RepID=UPI0025AA7EC8|nr:hypothetical protein [Crenobacter sp. SG2305]MDN0083400.1 hypothetical protein [Crenobacter sp. SG2305]